MTGALMLYSATFMRYSMAVSPKNYLLFACHFVNFGAQSTQMTRFIKYWKYVQYLLPRTHKHLRRFTVKIEGNGRLSQRSEDGVGGSFHW